MHRRQPHPASAAPASVVAVPTAPAVTVPAASGTPSGEPAAPRISGEAAPPRPEKLAEQAGNEAKSGPAPKPSLASEAPKPAAPAPEARGFHGGEAAQNGRRPKPPAETRAERQRRCGRCQAGQRRPAPDIFLCRRHAGGTVSPRRHRVAGVRFHQADRYRTDPQQGRLGYRRRQPAAAGKGSGDPHSAQPAANALADRRRSGQRRQLDAHLCRCDGKRRRNR